MTAAVLSVQPSKWAEVIEGHGEKCLIIPASAKNVAHVLSTATVRAPQKNLGAAVLPFVSKMLADANGASILTSLVKYGTVKTAESIIDAIVSADADTWALKKDVPAELAVSLGGLLEALIYREDCREGAAAGVVSAVSAAKADKVLSSAFTLTAAGRLFILDPKFAARIVKDDKGKTALKKVSLTTTGKNASIAFCETLLGAESTTAEASKFLFDTFFVPAPEASKRPREEIILAILSKCTPDVVSKIAKILSKWTNLQELLQRDAYANIFSEVILRASDADIAKKTALALFTTASEIDAMLTVRKKPYLRLLAAIDDKPEIVVALEKKLKTSLAGKLRGSKVRYTNSTLPRATSTQQAIMAKFERLRQSSGDKTSGKKRARE